MLNPFDEGSVVTHVVSLAITREDQPGRLLLGVRAPTSTSFRHPDVLSSPTMRIPAELMRAATATLGPGVTIPELGEIVVLDGQSDESVGCALSLRATVPYFTESLLTRKLGVAEPLVRGDLAGSARAGALAFDLVADPATEASELTLMLTVLVRISSGAELFPDATASYPRLDWVEADRLTAAVTDHDALQVLPDADLQVCLHGLCVRSASVLVDSLASGIGTA